MSHSVLEFQHEWAKLCAFILYNTLTFDPVFNLHCSGMRKMAKNSLCPKYQLTLLSIITEGGKGQPRGSQTTSPLEL